MKAETCPSDKPPGAAAAAVVVGPAAGPGLPAARCGFALASGVVGVASFVALTGSRTFFRGGANDLSENGMIHTMLLDKYIQSNKKLEQYSKL